MGVWRVVWKLFVTRNSGRMRVFLWSTYHMIFDDPNRFCNAENGLPKTKIDQKSTWFDFCCARQHQSGDDRRGRISIHIPPLVSLPLLLPSLFFNFIPPPSQPFGPHLSSSRLIPTPYDPIHGKGRLLKVRPNQAVALKAGLETHGRPKGGGVGIPSKPGRSLVHGWSKANFRYWIVGTLHGSWWITRVKSLLL